MSIKKLMKEIADKNGVSEEEVREEIKRAIEDAWTNPPDDGGMTVARQKKVPCRGEIPTPEEFICYAIGEIKRSK